MSTLHSKAQHALSLPSFHNTHLSMYAFNTTLHTVIYFFDLKCCCKACLTFFNLNISWQCSLVSLCVMFLSLNSQHIIHLPNITHPQSIKRFFLPHFIANHHGFPICKHLYQWSQQTSKRWTIGIPPQHESPPIQTYDSRSTHLPTPHKSELQQR
jgi:hypothetical protein